MNYIEITAKEVNKNITTDCVEVASYDDCATKISKTEADLVTLDGGRVFEAGRVSTRPLNSFLMISMELAICRKTIKRLTTSRKCGNSELYRSLKKKLVPQHFVSDGFQSV